MTNGEKYKTAKERTEAFERLCTSLTDCEKCPCYKQKGYSKCEFIWLDLEAEEEKPLPCPFCGGTIQVINDTQAIADNARWLVNCYCCPYEYGAETKEKLIAAHNRVAKAVMDAKAKEANDE